MLKLTGITKSYGGRPALDDVSFDVVPGRLTGFVGGNGAGKTTTMRIVLGVLAKDAGRVELDGAEVTASDRRRFGYMPEERGLYPKMKVLEQIVYLARLHGFSKTDAETRATALLEQLGLGERLARQRRDALARQPAARADRRRAGARTRGADPRRAVLGARPARRRRRRRRAAGSRCRGRRRAVLIAPARRRRAAVRRPRDHRRRHHPRGRSRETRCAPSTPRAASSSSRRATPDGCAPNRASRCSTSTAGTPSSTSTATRRPSACCVARSHRGMSRASRRSIPPSPRSSGRSSDEHPDHAGSEHRAERVARRRARDRLEVPQQGVSDLDDHPVPRRARPRHLGRHPGRVYERDTRRRDRGRSAVRGGRSRTRHHRRREPHRGRGPGDVREGGCRDRRATPRRRSDSP